MNTSKTLTTIIPLLLTVQRELEVVKKDSVNPYFHSNYADLNSIMDACKDVLNEKEIFILQPVGHDEHGDYVETILMHTSGEFISSQMRLVATTDAQKQGSAITYARRYALQSLLFIQSVDDDGNTASTPVKTPTVNVNVAEQDEAKRWGPCKKCGAPMKVSKNGNVVCSEACWTKQP